MGKTKLILSIVASSAFLVLSFFVGHNRLRDIDFLATAYFQTYIPPVVDPLFSVFTFFGSSEITALFVVVIAWWLFSLKRTIWWSGSIYGVIYLVEIIGKLFIIQPEVPSFFHRYQFSFHFPVSSLFHTGNSFPSGHMARFAFVSTIMFLLVWCLEKRIRKKIFITGSILLLFLIMFISRIYLGEHWFSDTLGGSLLGISIATFSLLFF